MGYLYNHLATVVCAAFAAVLSILWFLMVPVFPVLDFIFIMAVPIMWFLVAMCWMAQKSADYAHKHHAEKKSLISVEAQTSATFDEPASAEEIKDAQTELKEDLERLRDTLKLKDTEIGRLKQEIANLQTLVQIESLKSELAKLKLLASQ